MLQLLGDQLIKSPQIAVFELLKNSYDADATNTNVILNYISDAFRSSIIVEDDGSGMALETVIDVWLEPGTDYRARQRAEGRRSPRFGRLPMGEKGIGRFAVHKLGHRVEMVTRAQGRDEVVVSIDWDELERNDYLSDAAIRVIERPPHIFEGCTGTHIRIERLRETWTRRMVRTLGRSVTAMTSPFHDVSSFQPTLILEPSSDWLSGILHASDVLESALFRAHAVVEPTRWQMDYDYEFLPPVTVSRLKARQITRRDVPLGPSDTERTGRRYLDQLEKAAMRVLAQEGPDQTGVGAYTLDLHIFDLDSDTRRILQLTDYRGLSNYLNTNGGIRVYRDGIRVYDYGEQENDWLELDARRVNLPAQRISNHLVLGAVHLDSRNSFGLVEKTNREGFVESPSYELFRNSVQSAIQHIVFERNRDKGTLRTLAQHPRNSLEPVSSALSELRERVRQLSYANDLEPLIERAEREYERFREILLVTAGAGLTMTIVVHEVEKAVKALNRALDRDVDRGQLVELGLHLAEIIDALGFVARKSEHTDESASRLVQIALRAIEYRFAHHKIEVDNAFNQRNDFVLSGQRRLLVGALLNIFDNSIHWLSSKQSQIKRAFVGPSFDLGGVGAIVIADSGPGLLDPPELLTQPFMTRKKDGMGLGLYISSQIMQAHGGRLIFPEAGDLDLPREMRGACVALVFEER